MGEWISAALQAPGLVQDQKRAGYTARLCISTGERALFADNQGK